MLIIYIPAYLCKVIPSISKRVSPIFQIFIQVLFINLRVVLKIRPVVTDLLVTQIFLLQIVDNISVVLVVATEEHLWVVQIAVIPHLLIH